jgi:hypothetical protein
MSEHPMMRIWIPYVLPVSWLMVSIWYLTDAAVDLLPTYALMAGTALMVLAWIVGLVSRIGSRQPNDGAAAALSVEWLAFQTIAIAIVVLLFVSSAGLTVRTRLSAQALLASSCDAQGFIGLFHVREHECIGECRRFITARAFLDDAGLAYCPAGHPPRVGEDSYAHLYGGWWRWYRSW